MRDKPRLLALIVCIDMVGGVVLAAGAVLFGVSNPANLVEFVGENPVLGWIGIGAFGPLVGKRLIVGSVGRPEDVQEAESGPARFLRSLAHVRRNALRLLMEAHFTHCTRRDQRRLAHHRSCIKRLILERTLGFDDLQEVVMKYLNSLKIAPPQFLERVVRRLSAP